MRSSLMRNVVPVLRLCGNDADEGRADERSDDNAHVKSYVSVARTEVDEVAGAHGDDTCNGQYGHDAFRCIVDSGKAHG